jgi:prepilin-type N-terminal cleavage/methylation domain-containing protein
VRNARRGYTLVESLVVIALLAFTLSTVVLALHSLRRGDLSLRDDLEQERAVDRLVELLRQDAHRATAATLESGQDTKQLRNELRLSIGGNRTAEYSLASDGVVRLVREGEQVRQTDRFRVPLAATGRWQLDSKGELPLVTLWLPLGRKNVAEPNALRFCAVVGLEKE